MSRTHRASKVRNYYKKVGKQNWQFSTVSGLKLAKHADTLIKRHALVRPEKSPYDGDWAYWSSRRGQNIETPTRVAKLMKRQKGVCPHCGLYFTSDDQAEVDHILPRSLGGLDEYKNLQLLHRHCHDEKTATDGRRDN